MAEPIADEHLAKIRSVLDALGVVPPGAVYALLDEVKRLRKALHNGRAERDRLRAECADLESGLSDAADHARRLDQGLREIEAERDAARAEVEECRTSNRRLCDLAQQALDDKNTAAARATNQYAALHVERDRLAEQVKRVRGLHREHVHSGTCKFCWLAWPCPTIRALDGAEAGS